MSILFLIALNLALMLALGAYGVHQFLQVEEKRKGRALLAQLKLDEAELRGLLRSRRRDEAMSRLMDGAGVDRFTAESALDLLLAEDPALRESPYKPL